MPQETFMKLRGEYFNNVAKHAEKSLLKNTHEINPETQLLNELVDVPKNRG